MNNNDKPIESTNESFSKTVAVSVPILEDTTVISQFIEASEEQKEELNTDEDNFNFETSNSGLTAKYILLTILAGILTLLPISTLIISLFDKVNPATYISTLIYIGAYYITKIIGFLIYFLALRQLTKSKVILTIFAAIFLAFSLFMYFCLNNMENTGIDYIGEALGYTLLYKSSIYVYFILSFIIFLLYAKNFIFKKK